MRPFFLVRNRQVVGLYRLNEQKYPSHELNSKFGLYRIPFYSGLPDDDVSVVLAHGHGWQLPGGPTSSFIPVSGCVGMGPCALL